MQRRVAINFGSRRLQNFCLEPLSEAKHIDRAVYAGLGCLHGVELVVNRRGGAREVVYLVDLHVQRKGDIVSHQLEISLAQKVRDVLLSSRIKVVYAQYVVPLLNEALAEMRAQKSSAAGHQDSLHVVLFKRCRFRENSKAIVSTKSTTSGWVGMEYRALSVA